MTINYTLTTFNQNSGFKYTNHEAVCVRWDDAKKFVGGDLRGSPEEDDNMRSALLAAGAPAWVKDAAGDIDETCLYWLGPEIPESDDEE